MEAQVQALGLSGRKSVERLLGTLFLKKRKKDPQQVDSRSRLAKEVAKVDHRICKDIL